MKMKKQIRSRLSLLIILSMLCSTLLLSGCGKQEKDPNLGLYTAKFGSMSGVSVSVDEYFGEGFTVELKEKGKCEIFVDGEKASGKWSLDGKKFEMSGGGIECSGTLKKGVMTLKDVMGSGLELILINEDCEDLPDDYLKDSKDDGNDDDSDIDDILGAFGGDDGQGDSTFLSDDDAKWSGTWYGYISFSDCTGQFAEYNDETYGCYMVVEFTVEDGGVFTMYDGEDSFAEGDFLISGDSLEAVSGTAFGKEMNTAGYTFLSSNSVPNLIIMYDTIQNGSEILNYTIHLKPWGERWDESQGLIYYDSVIAPYIESLEAGEAPMYGWANPTYGAGTGNGGSEGSIVMPGGMSNGSDNNSGSSAGATDPEAVEADNYVIVDNDMFKVVATGKGVYEYNESWIGYTLYIENKTDYTIGFCSSAEEYPLDADIMTIDDDNCYYNGVITDTHFESMIRAGASSDKLVLAIDGITDVSQVENVKGYIKVWNNDSNDDSVIGYYPYSFK